MYPKFRHLAVEEGNSAAVAEYDEQIEASKKHAAQCRRTLDIAAKRFAALVNVEQRHPNHCRPRSTSSTQPPEPAAKILFQRIQGLPIKTYQCIVCGFIHDDSVGMPAEGIAAGTRWTDIPDDWECPDCGVAKSDFEMVEL